MLGIGSSWKDKAIKLEEGVVNSTKQLENAYFVLSEILKGNFEYNVENDLGSLSTILNKLGTQMHDYAKEDLQRRWISDGLVNFVGILRNDQTKKEELFQHILSSVVTYLKANQGGIFLTSSKNEELGLELVASYAYGKRRYQEKSIRIGEGLLGQCFLEKETTIYTDLPPFYTSITSGLGEATPGFLILIPIKSNEEVLGVLELASFQVFEKYQIDFLERIVESIASVVLNIQNTEKSTTMLLESEQREHILKEQEEELRQNLEELVSTQEEMMRKQIELDQHSNMLKLVLNNIPFPIFVKDELGRYTMVNKAEAALFSIAEEEIIGKDDSHFVTNEQEWKVIQDSDLKTLDSETPVELPLQSFTTFLGVKHIFRTTKIPFVNAITGKKNILGVSVDLTEKHNLEQRLIKEEAVSKNNLIIDLAGRQRMLSQKIGFYAEMVVRGKSQHIEELENTIALHEHSFDVLKNGGIPKGIDNAQIIEKASGLLMEYFNKIEDIWIDFKAATETIIELKSKKNDLSDLEKVNTSIQVVEDLGCLLLNANNDFLKAFCQSNKKNLVDSY